MGRVGVGVGALLALVLVSLAGVYGFTARRMGRHWDGIPRERIAARTDTASLTRGRHLATAIGKCVDCHGPDLGGRLFIDAGPAIGELYATNLTGGKGGVARAYTDADLERAIRHGVRPDGTPLRFMPAEEFNAMSDDDLEALLGYLRSLPPVDREPGRTRLGPLGRVLYLAGKFPLLAAERIDQRAPHTRTFTPAPTAEYGRYLARIGGCTGCHGEDLAGGPIPGTPPDIPPAQNLTPAGIGSWTEQDFVRALREGKRPDGSAINPFMPWTYTAQMTDDEIRAVWLYLRSVPPRVTASR